MSLIDTALVGSTNNKIYFFHGDQYVRCGTDGVEAGYPKAIDNGWNELYTDFPGPYDAAVRHYSRSDQYYFFKGGQYVRYTSGSGVDANYPKSIATRWKNLWSVFPGPYDAAVVGQLNNKYYFFKGDKYVRYTAGVGVDTGYPKNINAGWGGLYDDFPGSGSATSYDAVAPDPTDNQSYFFFSETGYARYTSGSGMDSGYPHSAAYDWYRLWTLGDSVGPLLGPCDATGPLLWLWLRQDEVVSLTGGTGLSLEVVSTRTHADMPGCVKLLRVAGLSAGASATVSLTTASGLDETITVRQAPAPTSQNDVVLLFGSCLDDARANVASIESLESIADDAPPASLMLWGGDNSYYVGGGSTGKGPVEAADMASMGDMFARQFSTRVHPSMARLGTTLPSLSTWDDHDFGFNDSTMGSDDRINMTSDQRDEAAEVFRLMWPNLYDESGDTAPIQSNYRWGGVHIFMTDGRYHRNEGDVAQILGSDQLDDLLTAMEASNAPVKVLVTATQLIPKRKNMKGENFESFPHDAVDERTTLLDRLAKMTGKVLILSGDIHSSELTFDGDTWTTPDVVELTSSPLLVGSSVLTPDGDDDDPSTRVWSVNGEGYARITVSFNAAGDSSIKMECLTTSGAAADIYGDGDGHADWQIARATWAENGDLSEQ